MQTQFPLPDQEPEQGQRRPTPLASRLAEAIRRSGPIPVEAFMQACLTDPEHGYYVRRPAIGSAGDFVTAPEISQVFGELIGLWIAVVWQQMGAPATVQLIELGPGRGTLMADALRAARVVPGFIDAVQLTLIESSAVLAVEQDAALAGHAFQRLPLAALDQVAAGPAIVIGNEFLDALPVRQAILTEDGWCERCVGLDSAGALAFVAGHPLPGAAATSDLPAGTIIERLDARPIVVPFARRAGAAALAALLIDYGHLQSAAGDTLQALREHRAEPPLASPGEADLTVQVDFAAFAETCRVAGLQIDGPVTQAQFLGQLGIVERASRLMTANPEHAGALETGVARLIAPGAMGSRFKAIGVRSPGLAPLPGLSGPPGA